MIPLTVHGKTENYLVSTTAYRQDQLGLRGVRFFITSPQKVSRHVARHVGNNAVYSFSRIIGQSSKMPHCPRQAEVIAHSDSNIIITGESGVGKDLFAQGIHNASRRRDNPFIVLNCAAIPRDLLASELFGYDDGAYTGAKKNGNLGKFELADTGTIFLDEIGDMPLDLPVMLLRVIEQKSFMRIGGNVTRSVDVKIISAANADLKSMVEKRTFRPDLYFRLCTLGLRLRPLRECGGDIILLAEYFIDNISTRLNRPQRKYLSGEAKELLLRLPWTGNVQELQNVMERVVQLIPSQVITPQDLSVCLDFSLENLHPVSAPVVRAAPAFQAAPSPRRLRESGGHQRGYSPGFGLLPLQPHHGRLLFGRFQKDILSKIKRAGHQALKKPAALFCGVAGFLEPVFTTVEYGLAGLFTGILRRFFLPSVRMPAEKVQQANTITPGIKRRGMSASR